jgi:hypothetical protein
MSTIVSLSTIPSRFPFLAPVLDGLLAQTASIDEIRLYIPKRYRRFPDFDGTLPAVPKGVRICQTSDDLGPASKVLFAVDDLRGSDCRIIYCDDDIIYEPTRFAQMVAESDIRPNTCISPDGGDFDGGKFPRQPRAVFAQKNFGYRLSRLRQLALELASGKKRAKPDFPHMRRAGYVAIARGWGAVLVRPEFFSADAMDIPAIVWSVDDYWLSGNMACNDVPIWAPTGIPKPRYAGGVDVDALLDTTIDGHGRRDANQACVKYMQQTYGIWQ